MLKILHLGPQNFAGVPYSFYEMHNRCGDYSRLITYYKNPNAFKEDICLNLPYPTSSLASFWRKKKKSQVQQKQLTEAPVFTPKNLIEQSYFSFK